MVAFALFCLVYFLAIALTYFNSILALAAVGKVRVEPSLDGDLRRAAVNCGIWFACFLAGPSLAFGGAFAYWLYGGELDWVDWIILTELGVVGLGWWLISLLVANTGESFRVPFPDEVFRIAKQMGHEGFVLLTLATVAFGLHLWVADYAIGGLHEQPVMSLFLMSLFWGSGLFVTSYTLRRLGLAYSRIV
jgi:hypothetical protein